MSSNPSTDDGRTGWQVALNLIYSVSPDPTAPVQILAPAETLGMFRHANRKDLKNVRENLKNVVDAVQYYERKHDSLLARAKLAIKYSQKKQSK